MNEWRACHVLRGRVPELFRNLVVLKFEHDTLVRRNACEEEAEDGVSAVEGQWTGIDEE